MSWLRDVDRWMCAEVLPHQYAYQALARRLTGNIEVARDVVQDVYAEILAGTNWQKAIDPKAYVLRIVYCRSVNWVNRQKIIPIHQLATYEGLAHSDVGPDAFDNLSGREELEAVFEILDGMPVRCRQVIIMRRVEDLPPREIARRLGIDLVTVRRHMARGLAILTQRLAERGSVRRQRIVVSGDGLAVNDE
ncbi:RNA polymerase sigma factor [Asticcacaulis sp.]|uniref:RNA polymerase sigma factor n=1 Tax=Asticcacaulis sp. TaxID=1872648 RepID=UPI002BE371E0|nr:RNA polymerase sigma factor [Asticcacaulis sp.]HTM82199.1 RNA polymerase sigma factor [Asticcacaulis sp.]